jgi:proteasome lid subunit RPN8/RPN11
MWEIPRVIVNRIFGHAQRTAPQECVGILSGTGEHITHWHPLTNSLTDTRRFLADPTEQITLFKRLRDEGRTVMALYHSHPTGSTEPSDADLAQSHYPKALYLIVGLGEDGRLDLAGYRIQAGVAHPETLTIREQA